MARTSSRYQKVIRDTAAVLAAANRIYPAGWLIIESDVAEPNNIKEADGVTAYNSLSYGLGGSGGGTVGDATTTVKGVVRLSVAPVSSTAPIAAGTNDPRMTDARQPLSHTHAQSEITGLTSALSAKANLLPATGTGTAITFLQDTVHGTVGTPVTGNITADTNGAISGATVMLIHNSGTAPTFDSKFKKLSGSGNYVTGVVNYIFATFINPTEIIYSINQRT